MQSNSTALQATTTLFYWITSDCYKCTSLCGQRVWVSFFCLCTPLVLALPFETHLTLSVSHAKARRVEQNPTEDSITSASHVDKICRPIVKE